MPPAEAMTSRALVRPDACPNDSMEGIHVSDDLREREPDREQTDFPPGDGIRRDGAGTGAGVVGPAPAGGDPERLAEGPAGDREQASDIAETAGGADGSGASRPGAGGSADGTRSAGDDAQTEWLRGEDSRAS